MTASDRCFEARERMQALLDGPLSSGDRRALDAHAAECPACREALADTTALARALSAWPRVAPSAGFADRVLAAIRAKRPAREPLPARVLIALAAVALGLTGVLLAPQTREWFARWLAAGTERGASDAVVLSRALAAVLTALVPLFERAAELVAPLAATVRALAIAVQHVSAGPVGLAAAVLVALAAVFLIRHLLNPRERRGLHVLLY
jgi:predicted anti-sigma-YlaC factor YlaD